MKRGGPLRIRPRINAESERSGGGAEYRLDLEELLEALGAPLASVAGLLVAAERSREVRPGAVDVHVAGAEAGGDLLRVLRIPRLHVAGETVRGVVRHRDRFLLRLVRQDAEDGSED